MQNVPPLPEPSERHKILFPRETQQFLKSSKKPFSCRIGNGMFFCMCNRPEIIRQMSIRQRGRVLEMTARQDGCFESAKTPFCPPPPLFREKKKPEVLHHRASRDSSVLFSRRFFSSEKTPFAPSERRSPFFKTTATDK